MHGSAAIVVWVRVRVRVAAAVVRRCQGLRAGMNCQRVHLNILSRHCHIAHAPLIPRLSPHDPVARRGRGGGLQLRVMVDLRLRGEVRFINKGRGWQQRRAHLLQGYRDQMGKYRRAEVEQAQRHRGDGLHPPPLIFKQRARAARHQGAGRNGRARGEFVADVDARAADADTVVQQAIAEHYFER